MRGKGPYRFTTPFPSFQPPSPFDGQLDLLEPDSGRVVPALLEPPPPQISPVPPTILAPAPALVPVPVTPSPSVPQPQPQPAGPVKSRKKRVRWMNEHAWKKEEDQA